MALTAEEREASMECDEFVAASDAAGGKRPAESTHPSEGVTPHGPRTASATARKPAGKVKKMGWLTVSCPANTQGVASFDLATALTKKETRTMRKSECMIQYHLARMPMYGAYESAQYAKANELRENMKNLEMKAKERWERGHV
ncbi:hypothetical protein AB1Y20_000228 [Prymnesium parvum]|uniref:Nucleolar protein 16 n=1 Tax=Prymnesium parvum TaxID=97485 RepID=A0AB34K495_PRYPA